MSVPNLKRIALIFQKLLGGSQNFEFGSSDPKPRPLWGHFMIQTQYGSYCVPIGVKSCWRRICVNKSCFVDRIWLYQIQCLDAGTVFDTVPVSNQALYLNSAWFRVIKHNALCFKWLKHNHYYASAPYDGGIKRCFSLTSVWRLTFVCVSRTSGVTREQWGLGRLKLAQK